MPGWANSDNKFGPGPFIVAPVLGNGGNYSSVQTAINDCAAAGGGTVFIQTGTYLENLTLQAGVDLKGFDVDGRLPSVLSHVVIQGNHSYVVAGGFGAVIAENITFSCLAGDLFTLSPTGGGQAIFATKFCGLEAFTDPASRAIVFNPDGTSAAQFSTDNCNINAATHTFESIGAGSCAASLSLGSCNSASGNVFQLTAGSGSFSGQYCQISGANFIFNGLTPNGQCEFDYCMLNSTEETVVFPAANGQAVMRHSIINTSAASTNFIDGTGGQLDYVDLSFFGSASNIGGSITQVFGDWKPYGATTHVGINRYNPVHFTVSATNGEVSLISPPLFPWTDIAASGPVVENNGYFVTASITLTLPVAPVQGDSIKFKVDGAFVLVIQASGTQLLKFSNQTSIAGGTATSSQDGDAVEITYRAASDTWIANAIIGNWLVI